MNTFINFYVISILLHLLVVNVKSAGLTEIFGWKQIDFEMAEGLDGDTSVSHHHHHQHLDHHHHPYHQHHHHRSKGNSTWRNNDSLPEKGAQSDTFLPYNNIPIGVNHYKEKLFITVPRRRSGIPSSLNYINLNTVGSNRNPKLRPFPNLETNTLMPDLKPNASRIISVYRTRVDSCNRLWFIDTGMLEIPNNRTQVQRPSIWIFDLESNKKLHRFEISESLVETGNGLVSITVDADTSACNQAFAYIPDLANSKLYVYSLEQNHIWTFNHDFFHFDPAQTALNIGGYNFTLNDGIFSITLGNKQPDGYKLAYFHPLASLNEFVVPTSVLQNENNAIRSLHRDDFKLLGTRGLQKQSTMHDFDPTTGIIFYAEIMRNGVGCWNTKKTAFSEQNHGQIASDSEKMIYPSDLTIDNEGNGWVMTNSMPIFLFSQLNPNEVNFRIWKFSARSAAKNTVCHT